MRTLIHGATCAGLLCVTTASAQTTRELYRMGPFGDISVAVEHDGVVYVGGTFAEAGPACSHAVIVHGTTGALVEDLQIDGTVHTIVADGAGGWFIGGRFSSAQDQPRDGIARLNADFSLSNWSPVSNDVVEIRAIALMDTALFVAGTFVSDHFTYPAIVAYDVRSGERLPWSTQRPDDDVLALAVIGNLLYAGGEFRAIGFLERQSMAAFDVMTGGVHPWNVGVTDGAVQALAVHDSRLWAGGSFRQIGTRLRPYLAELDPVTGVAVDPAPPAPDDHLTAMTFEGSTLYLAGNFLAIAEQPRAIVGAIDVGENSVTSWDPTTSGGTAAAISVASGTVYVGASLTGRGGSRRYATAISIATATITPWDPRPNLGVSAVAGNGSLVFLGGDFSAVGSTPRRGLAAFRARTGQLTTWDPEADVLLGGIRILDADGDRIYVVGAFSTIADEARNGVASVYVRTGYATGFDPGPGALIRALEAQGGDVFVGGSFGFYGGEPRSNLAELDPDTGDLLDWAPQINGPVNAIRATPEFVYIGGEFGMVDGQVRWNVAAFDRDTKELAPWTPDANAPVRLIAVGDYGVYVAGDFDAIGGKSRYRIAAVDPLSGVASDWVAEGVGVAHWIAPLGSVVYVNLSARDAITGQRTWHVNLDDQIQALAVTPTAVFAGGDSFWTISPARSRETAPAPADRARPLLAGTWVSPNPASGVTTLGGDLEVRSRLRVRIFDVMGRQVATLLDGVSSPGPFLITWSGRTSTGVATSGVYFARFEVDGRSATERIVVVR
jgi:hypothetical protein